VVIAPVDQGDVNGRVLQRFRCAQAAKARADNHDARQRRINFSGIIKARHCSPPDTANI